jgi:hypothetical protein
MESRHKMAFSYPERLPHSWHESWEYTFTRSKGESRRNVLRKILERNVLHQFSSSELVNGDIEDNYEIFMKNEARLVELSTRVPPWKKIFHHNPKMSDDICQMTLLKCVRESEDTCYYT